MDTVTALPDENIDPRLKREKPFLLQYAKAVWNNSETSPFASIFYRNHARYEEIKDYALGQQSVAKYKPMLGIDEADDKTWLNIDWSIRQILPKFRNIVINELHKKKYRTQCTPIDPLAKDEMDKEYADVKAKIMMRDMLQKNNSDLANMAMLKQQPGEPEDLEELEMQIEFGGKNNRAMEAELGIEVVFNENNIDDAEREIIESSVDYGVAGYEEWIDTNGRVQLEPMDMRFFGCNYCRKKNFSDMTQGWRIVDVPISELATIFPNDDDIAQITETARQRNYYGGNGDARGSVYGYDPTKARVMKLKFITYDKEVRETNISSKGNMVTARAEYKHRDKQDKVTINGKQENRYTTKKVQNMYECKWIIGTDFIYDYGLSKKQKRSTDPKEGAKTSLPFHVYAANFHEMKANSLMDALIPVADEYQLTVYRIQNFKNRWVPYIIDIDLNAIEDVALGAGGAKMKPSEVLQMMFQTNALLSRKRDMSGGNANYKSVDISPTGMAAEFTALAQDLDRIVNIFRDISGLNELTDGSTPDSHTLVPVAAAAQDATNNALSGIIYARKYLRESLANGVLERLQIAVAMNGKYGGYYNALGSGSIKFFQVSKDICLHYYGIKLEEVTSDEMKQFMVQYMQTDIAAGNVSCADIFMVMDMYNTKQAYQYLNYIVKKNKAKAQSDAIQMQQTNGQIQTQSIQAKAQADQQTAAYISNLKINEINAEKQWDFKIKMAQAEATTEDKHLDTATKIGVAAMQSGHNYMPDPNTAPQPQPPAPAPGTDPALVMP